MTGSLHVSDLNNRPVNLFDSIKGKPVLLLIYNNRCLGCTGRALPMAYDFNLKYPELKVIGIHSNFKNDIIHKRDIENVFTTKQLPFPIFIDPRKKVYRQFECEGVPHWVILNKKSEVIHSIFGSQEAAQTRLSYALDELIE